MLRDTIELTETALALADAARQAALPYFRMTGLEADDKGVGAFDPVTEADRAVETALRKILADRRPDDGILGEEYGTTASTSGLTWVLDPIDGTRAFLAGAPTWGVLIAVGPEGQAPGPGPDRPAIHRRTVLRRPRGGLDRRPRRAARPWPPGHRARCRRRSC